MHQPSSEAPHFYDEQFREPPRHRRERFPKGAWQKLAAVTTLGAMTLGMYGFTANDKLSRNITASNAEVTKTRLVPLDTPEIRQARGQIDRNAKTQRYQLCIDVFHGFASNNGKRIAEKVARHVDPTTVDVRHAEYAKGPNGTDFTTAALADAMEDGSENCDELGIVAVSLGMTFANEARKQAKGLPKIRFILNISGPRTINQVKNGSFISALDASGSAVPPWIDYSHRAVRCLSGIAAEEAPGCLADEWDTVSTQESPQQQRAELHVFTGIITDDRYNLQRQDFTDDAEMVSVAPPEAADDPTIHAYQAIADWHVYYGESLRQYTVIAPRMTHASAGIAIDSVASWLQLRSSPRTPSGDTVQYIPHAA